MGILIYNIIAFIAFLIILFCVLYVNYSEPVPPKMKWTMLLQIAFCAMIWPLFLLTLLLIILIEGLR